MGSLVVGVAEGTSVLERGDTCVHRHWFGMKKMDGRLYAVKDTCMNRCVSGYEIGFMCIAH